MSLPKRTTEPSVIVAGEKVEWTISLDDYPASLWNLVYYFRGIGTGVNVTATASGNAFVLSMSATASAAFSAGKYKYQAWASKTSDATDKHVVREGFARVEAALVAATTAVDLRTTAKKIVDAIEAAFLTGSNQSDVIEYEFSTPAGMRRVKKSKREAKELLEYYKKIVARENANERVRQGKSYAQTTVVRLNEV